MVSSLRPKHSGLLNLKTLWITTAQKHFELLRPKNTRGRSLDQSDSNFFFLYCRVFCVSYITIALTYLSQITTKYTMNLTYSFTEHTYRLFKTKGL